MSLLLGALTPLVGIASPAHGEDADVVEFPVTHAVGDVHEFVFTRSRIQTSPDSPPVEVSIHNEARLEVREHNEQGFVLSWSTEWEEIRSLMSSLPVEPGDEWVASMIDEINDHTLLIQTDELSTPLFLVNDEETIALFRRLVDGLFAELPLPDGSREQAEAMIRQILSPEFITSRAMQDVQLLFMFVGGSYEVGAEYGYEDVLANPLGGDPFPARVIFVVDEVDREAGTAHVSWEQETDPTAVRAFFEEFFRQAPNGEEALEAVRDLELGIFSNASFSVDLVSGLPRRIEHERSIQFGPGGRVDRVVIDRRTP